MPYIIINKDDNEDMRSQMRQQMRNTSGIRRMNMRGHDSEIERAYKEGYTHGYKDAVEDNSLEMSSIENRRERNSRGRFV